MKPRIELDAISSFAQNLLPSTSAIELLNLPDKPYNGMVVFRFLGEEPRMVNGWQSEHIRQWQVINFDGHPMDNVDTAAALGKAFIHGVTIPYTDEHGGMWYTRVQAYSVGQQQETEDGLNVILSILETKTGAVATQEQYELMMTYIMTIGGI